MCIRDSHNPEFTLMELYQAYTDYEGMMELTESMFRYLAEKVCGLSLIHIYCGQENYKALWHFPQRR